MNAQLIVTHPGGAHFDEVTAISLILAANAGSEFRVERRDPRPSELQDSTIWVVDTGRLHEPQRLNFDHHQSLDTPASFVLLADYLGLLPDLKVMPWWDFKDAVDRFGPVRSAQKFGAGDFVVNRDPMGEWLIGAFASNPQGSLAALASYGRFLIDGALRFRKQIDFWIAAPRIVISGLRAVIGETKDSLGLDEFRRLDKNPPDVVISLDSQGDGWRLFRFDGVPVDFTRISGSSQIEFAHKSGFLAKTRGRIPIDEVVALIERAAIRK